MRGLIRKDMYCLKKNLKLFFGVTVGVILISVLFILSAQYGNIAKGIEEMKAESNLGEETFYSFFQVGIWLALFIPISFLTMITECFKEDKKAGFLKYEFCMPLSNSKIVGSRYASCLLFALVSLAGSLLAAFFVSLASNAILFTELFGYVLCFSAALLIYMSFVMFMIYLFGAKRADLLQCIPFVILLVGGIVGFWQKLSVLEEAEMDTYLLQLMDSISAFMVQKCGLIFLTALICMALSFLGSCYIFRQRKGDI